MPAVRPDAPRSLQRLPVVDLVRGLAIVQMIAYHFVYDLTYFGWLHIEMTQEPGWIAWRNAIVSQFLLISGVGLGLGDAAGRSGTRFWRRWGQIAAAAALVSLASAWLFGPRLIWFGILHFVAVALLLGRPLASLGPLNALVGVALLALGLTVHTEHFDPAWVSWIGLAGLWQQRGFALPPSWQRLDSAPSRALRALGRWPLTVYLLHQPIMMGALYLVRPALMS